MLSRRFHSMGTVSQTQEPFIRLLGCSWVDLRWRIVCVTSRSQSPECSSGELLAPCPPFHTWTPQRAQLSAGRLWGRQAKSRGPGARSLWIGASRRVSPPAPHVLPHRDDLPPHPRPTTSPHEGPVVCSP